MVEISKKYKIKTPKFGSVNWIGAVTLWRKEVERILNVWIQTILSPLVLTLLFWSVLNLSIGEYRGNVLGVPFTTFLWPGLISMSIIQASFAHTSSSIMVGKMLNTLDDVIKAPLNAAETTLAIILAACTRSFLITLLSIVMFSFLTDLTIHSIPLLIIFTFLGSFILGSVGFSCALFADKYDEMSGIQNFVILPASMLSGVFFLNERLNPFFQTIMQFNPFWYIIDGTRFAFLGIADGSITVGLLYLSGLAIVAWLISFLLYSRGYKIKT
jgi:ABC-2 type transport system permease protein